MFQFYGGVQSFVFLIVPIIIGMIIHILIQINSLFEFLYPIPSFYWFVSLLWGLYPALIKTEKFFIKRGYSNVVFEYIFIKKFLIISIPLMIILHLSFFIEFNNLAKSENFYILLIRQSTILLSSIIYAAFLRIITQIVKKDFRFYLTRGYCEIISNKNDNIEKTKYLFSLLRSYNKYLQRNLKIKINDINKIYSIILSKDIKERDQVTKSLCDSLQVDRLNLAKYLYSFQQIPDSEYYIKESLIQQLKVIGVFLAAAIPIIISVIQSIIQIPKVPP